MIQPQFRKFLNSATILHILLIIVKIFQIVFDGIIVLTLAFTKNINQPLIHLQLFLVNFAFQDW